MRFLATLFVLAALAACSRSEPPAGTGAASSADALSAEAGSALAEATPVADVPAGSYTLDKYHASLLFRVDHLGFSNYTARFKQFDAKLEFDPANLTAAKLEASVDARSIETDLKEPSLDFNAQLQGEQFLDTAQWPQMTYRSTRIEQTGPNTIRVYGDLTLRGVTRPVPLDVTFNGGYRGMQLDPHARIGFSGRGVLKRSEFGMTAGIPEAGSKFGVSDEVEVIIEAEFNGPPTPNLPQSS